MKGSPESVCSLACERIVFPTEVSLNLVEQTRDFGLAPRKSLMSSSGTSD